MPLQKLKLIFFLSVVVFSSALIADNYPKKILFIGNSYLYYNDSLHNHLRRMAEEKFPDRSNLISYKSSTIGGSRLEHHNIDHLLKATNIGVKTPFELVVFKQVQKLTWNWP